MGRSKVIHKESILVDNLIVIDVMQITNRLIKLGSQFMHHHHQAAGVRSEHEMAVAGVGGDCFIAPYFVRLASNAVNSKNSPGPQQS